MAASDQMVWQGELAVEQAIRQLQGQSVSDNVSPPILVMTPKMPTANISAARCRGDFVGLFLSAHISG